MGQLRLLAAVGTIMVLSFFTEGCGKETTYSGCQDYRAEEILGCYHRYYSCPTCMVKFSDGKHRAVCNPVIGGYYKVCEL